MPSIISTIGYITEANTTPSSNSPDTIITKGIIACNRPKKNDPLFINFVAFNNSKDKKNNELQSIDPKLVYLLHGKFVYNTIKKFNGESNEELQVNDFNYLQNFLFFTKFSCLYIINFLSSGDLLTFFSAFFLLGTNFRVKKNCL